MKPVDHESVISALSAEADFTEVYEERSRIELVENDTGRIEKCLQLADSGCSIRSFRGSDMIFTASNTLDDTALTATHRKSLGGGSAGASGGLLYEKRFLKDFAFASPFDTRISLTSQLYDRLKAALPNMLNSRIVFQRYEKGFTVSNSLGVSVNSLTAGERFSVHLTVEASGEKFTIFESTGYTFDNIEEAEIDGIIEICVRRAELMKTAKPGPSGVMPCIVSSEAGGTLIHEAVGHGLEADLVDKGISIYREKLGQQVASKLITVVDDATTPGGWGSFFCDDEGAPSQRTVLIEKGILTNYLYDLHYSMKHKAATTGNGRRQGYMYKPYPRMTNTAIVPGNDAPADLIRSVDKGVLVKKMGGGQVNTLTGDFIFEILEGYMLEKGEIAWPIKNCSIIGNGPAVLGEIDGVASDFGTSLGTCGKEGQGVPVGDGQPTIRIPKITIGGTAGQ